MTDYTPEKVAGLIRAARFWATKPDEYVEDEKIIALADALEAVTAERDRFYEGLYQVYVQLGEDTDGARNAAELFRPMVNCDPAEWVPRLVADYRAEMEAEAEDRDMWKGMYEVRSEYAADLEAIILRAGRPAPRNDLTVLRQFQAEAWDEGVKDMMRAVSDEQTISFIAPHNPYRKEQQS